MKKIIFLLTFLLIILPSNVFALNLSAPEVYTYFSDGTEISGTASAAVYFGDYLYWQSNSKIGSFTSASPNATKTHFFWNNANLCQGKDVSISGTIAVLSDFFIQQTYNATILMNNQPLTCSFTQENSSRIRYNCYGKGGGHFQIFFEETSFYGSYLNYDIAASRTIDLSCDVSNESIVNQSITNTQNIINNQNTNTQDIINNNSENTQDIIDNQNSNTQDIIDNQNQNTQEQIESQKVCDLIDKEDITEDNKYLSHRGVVSESPNFGVTDFINIENANITIIEGIQIENSVVAYCFYNENKQLINCTNFQNIQSNSSVTIPNNAKYLKTSIFKLGNKPTFNICRNGNQALNDSINGLNDTLNDTSSPDTESEIDDLKEDLISDTPITDLITLPISLLNSYINGFSGTCSSYNLGNLYGTDLILPCLNLEQRLGSNLWTIIDSLFSIFMIYNIAMLMIQAFEGFTSLRDDYEGLYQPKHADMGYQPKHGGGN